MLRIKRSTLNRHTILQTAERPKAQGPNCLTDVTHVSATVEAEIHDNKLSILLILVIHSHS